MLPVSQPSASKVLWQEHQQVKLFYLSMLVLVPEPL